MIDFENCRCDCLTAANKQGIEDLKYAFNGQWTKNVYAQSFTIRDGRTIDSDIWGKFNDEFNLLIDYFEEEEIPCDKLPRAKEILCEFLKGNITDIQRSVAQKILSVVEKGIEVGSPVELEL